MSVFTKWIFFAFLSFFVLWCQFPKAGNCEDAPTCELSQVVVTATRSVQPVKEIPSTVDVISKKEIRQTVAKDLTQVLKKDSSVDVIEYPGALSGISIRGFRPEFSGITKHVLILIDGRPAGATNLSTILPDNIERIEVLKGPASSLYGAEAMGGVVNIITKKSTGTPTGAIYAGGGSFDTWKAGMNLGGSLSHGFDFDFSASTRNRDSDIKLGNKHGTRPGTTYNIGYTSLRLGKKLTEGWRMDVRGDWYYGNDIETPGALYYGDVQQSQKDLDRYSGEARLEGTWGANKSLFVLYSSSESSDYYKKYAYDYTTGTYVPTSPYHSYYSQKRWRGCQVQNVYRFLGRHDITTGLDYESIDEESKSYNPDGSRRAPWSPDANRENWGVFTDSLWRFMEDRLVLSAGLRYDYFNVETKQTPYKTDFYPGSVSFDTFSPRAGIKFNLNDTFNLHSTIGKAFVPPTASQMAGYSERIVNGVTMVTRGNPNLNPETSWTWDGGIGVDHKRSGFSSDVTVFSTKVDDKITSVTTGTVTTYENTSDAEMAGLEFKASWNIGKLLNLDRKVSFFLNGTRLFYSREKIQGADWTDIHNVAHWKLNYGAEYDDGMFSGRVLARYVGKRKDNDWYSVGYPVIEYNGFTVVDLFLGMTFKEQHQISLKVNNLFNKFYYEKPEFPLEGRSWYLEYRFKF